MIGEQQIGVCAAPGSRQRTRAGMRHRRNPAVPPPSGRTPAPGTIRPAGCGPARDRRAAAASRPRSSLSCGVSVRRTSATGANAETISETGATTRRSSPPSRHTVRIDIESLPTGIGDAERRAELLAHRMHGVVEIARPRPARRRPPSSWPTARMSSMRRDIGRGDVRDRLGDRHAAGRRRDRATRAACARPSPSPRLASRNNP